VILQVQQRVADLIRIIDGLLVEMQTQGSHWAGFLDKLAVINMTHAQVGARPCCQAPACFQHHEPGWPHLLTVLLLPATP